MKKICNYCELDFEAANSSIKYCSRRCYFEHRRKKAKELPKNIFIKVSDGIYKKHTKTSQKGHNLKTTIYFEVACLACGKKLLREKSQIINKKAKKFHCSPECRKILFSGSNNPTLKYRKNKRGKQGGHILIYKPNHPNARKGYIPEHRIIIEKDIGRLLKSTEFVHHINCNPRDNRIDNLFIVDKWTHNSIHSAIEKSIEKLMEMGILKFNKKSLEYEVVE